MTLTHHAARPGRSGRRAVGHGWAGRSPEAPRAASRQPDGALPAAARELCLAADTTGNAIAPRGNRTSSRSDLSCRHAQVSAVWPVNRRERTWRRGRGAGADLSGRSAHMASGRRGSQQARGQLPPGRRFRSAVFQPFLIRFSAGSSRYQPKNAKQPKWKTAHNWRDGPGQASRPPEVGPLGQA
jgi:hypothetical protein